MKVKFSCTDFMPFISLEKVVRHLIWGIERQSFSLSSRF
jgi:hypothetical protein